MCDDGTTVARSPPFEDEDSWYIFSDAAHGDAEADAHLIEASPDLYDACKAAIPWLAKMIADEGHANCARPSLCVKALLDMEAAVKKAEGGAS